MELDELTSSIVEQSATLIQELSRLNFAKLVFQTGCDGSQEMLDLLTEQYLIPNNALPTLGNLKKALAAVKESGADVQKPIKKVITVDSLTYADIQRMDSNTYKKLLSNPEFQKRIEELIAQHK